MIAKNTDGDVRIVNEHEDPTSHGALVGSARGWLQGVVAALFPPVGILSAQQFQANLFADTSAPSIVGRSLATHKT